MLRTVTATSYVTALREGGSLPGIVEADDDGLYVVKFHGAGQGPLVLVAELIAGEVGRALDLLVPELVYVQLDAAFGRKEPDYEIRELLRASAGLNLGLDYLPGSLAFEALAASRVDADLASAIVWFDAYVMNVDRSPRNTNMLMWHKRLWLIDHGASLYFQHGLANSPDLKADFLAQSARPFAPIRQHALLPYATKLREAGERLRPRLSDKVLAGIVAAVPDVWLTNKAGALQTASPEEQRAAYLAFLQARRDASSVFVEEAERERALLV
jgi:hypothetical protein